MTQQEPPAAQSSATTAPAVRSCPARSWMPPGPATPGRRFLLPKSDCREGSPAVGSKRSQESTAESTLNWQPIRDQNQLRRVQASCVSASPGVARSRKKCQCGVPRSRWFVCTTPPRKKLVFTRPRVLCYNVSYHSSAVSSQASEWFSLPGSTFHCASPTWVRELRRLLVRHVLPRLALRPRVTVLLHL